MSDNENSQDLINFDSDDYWMVEIEDLVDKKTVNNETTVEKKTDDFDSDDEWMVEIEDLVDKKTTDELVNDETTVEKKTDDSANRYKRPGNNLLQSVSNALQPSCTVTKK